MRIFNNVRSWWHQHRVDHATNRLDKAIQTINVRMLQKANAAELLCPIAPSKKISPGASMPILETVARYVLKNRPKWKRNHQDFYLPKRDDLPLAIHYTAKDDLVLVQLKSKIGWQVIPDIENDPDPSKPGKFSTDFDTGKAYFNRFGSKINIQNHIENEENYAKADPHILDTFEYIAPYIYAEINKHPGCVHYTPSVIYVPNSNVPFQKTNACYFNWRGDLYDYICDEKQSSPKEQKQCMRSFIKLVKDMAELHHKGIVWRDLKADNIIISDSGRFLLGDPFMAIDVRQLLDFVPFCGTPGYYPEDIKNTLNPQAEQLKKGDVFAIGKVLFQLYSYDKLSILANQKTDFENLLNSLKDKDFTKRPSLQHLAQELSTYL